MKIYREIRHDITNLHRKKEALVAARLIDKAVYHLIPSSHSPESDAIPASRLEEILHGLNDIVLGLADKKKDTELDERMRAVPKDEEKEHYVLYLRPSVPGSFAVPVELYDTRGPENNQEPIFPGFEINFQEVAGLIQLANQGNREEFYKKIKSPVVALKIEKGIEKIAPREGEKAEFTLSNIDAAAVPILPEARANVIEWQSICVGPFQQELIVNVSSIDLEDGSIRVKLPTNGKRFSVPLNPELEQIRLEEFSGKKWVILCDALYTPNGMISEIRSVEDIHELALRELRITSFEAANKTIKFRSPLLACEKLDEETGSLFVVEIPELDVLVFSDNQADMYSLLCYELANKWEWIVCAQDEDLTPRAAEVKKTFLSLVESEVK